MQLDSQRTKSLRALEAKLEINFTNLLLLNEALTHSSHAHETGGIPYNERLEFLGDAVVGLVVSHLLFEEFPHRPEGELARAKANLVSAASMVQIGNQLGLAQLVLLGRGERRSNGRGRSSIVADALEALIGAIYLDQPWNVTQSVVKRLWEPSLIAISTASSAVLDAKSALQEYFQGKGEGTPEYRLKDAYGPDHDKTFRAEVLHGGKVIAEGTGRSKREAEQDAARKALATL